MKQIQQKLLLWFNKYGRESLPWRTTDNVYHIYLSEIMLQQTQVERVALDYFPKFLYHFPTLKSITFTSLENIHSLWSGLGYYSRATNLYKTAQLTQGVLPQSTKELQQLPGIGKYTASAICCFGYNQSIPVVDTNIKRVLKRFFALKDPKESEVWQYAQQFLNKNEPKKHNLALMDLGATICTAKKTYCKQCPLEQKCLAKENPQEFTQIKKQQSISMDLFYGIYIKNNKIAFLKSDGPMYKGLFVLPSCEPIDEEFIGSFKHAYTKYRLNVFIYHIKEKPLEEINAFLTPQEALQAPISSLTRKSLKLFLKSNQTN